MYETMNASPNLDNFFFKRLYSDFVGNQDESVILTHFGELSEDLISNLTEGLEQVLIVKKCSPKMIKRMFGVVLNGLSNICCYFDESKGLNNLGHIIVKDSGKRYGISIGNVVDEKCKLKLIEHINNLNNMERSQVRDFYNRSLWDKDDSPKKNIFVGFNSIAVFSKSRINYGISNLNEKSKQYYLSTSFDLEDD